MSAQAIYREARIPPGYIGVYQEQSELELAGILHQTDWRNRGA
jgi:hypothetical protein